MCLHTDSLNESTELEGTVEAIAGRTIHAYHVEGSGGGHIPDALGLVREPNIFCSSTTPTLPYGPATAAEQLDMKLIVHEGNPSLPEDVAAALELVHPATMAAEGPLHELGAIQIVNSDSQGMGRIGETLRRTFQLADVMKAWRCGESGPRTRRSIGRARLSRPTTAEPDDNERVLRYLAKCTTEPAITHGIAERGRLARARAHGRHRAWEATQFGVKPVMVLKGGRRRLERDGRRERQRARRGADPLRPRLGRARRRAGAAVDHVRLASRARRRLRVDDRAQRRPVRGTRGLTRDALVANRRFAARPHRLADRRHRHDRRSRARLRPDTGGADLAPLPPGLAGHARGVSNRSPARRVRPRRGRAGDAPTP